MPTDLVPCAAVPRGAYMLTQQHADGSISYAVTFGDGRVASGVVSAEQLRAMIDRAWESVAAIDTAKARGGE